jgi:hypothetical protein
MAFLLVVVICAGSQCDRIVKRVDNCVLNGLQAQTMLAQTSFDLTGKKIEIKCEKIALKN